jgi:20S proteasome alpha/beta subunit
MTILLLSILLCSLAMLTHASSAAATPRGATSPIRHWDASWAASCAQGTAIAIRCENCALLFLRSPATNIWRPPIASHEEVINILGLDVIPVAAQHSSSADVRVQFGPSWLAFEMSLCAMTGLASDVEHLSRVMQRQVDGHFNVYQKSPTTHVMRHTISRLLQQTTSSQGGRPFGAQILLLGCDGLTNTAADRHPSATADGDSVCFYTIDPSGSWQSWGGRGTAIGKFAPQVRTQLSKLVVKSIRDRSSKSDGLMEGLKTIYTCWKLACKEENVINAREAEDYQVLVLWRDEDTQVCRLGIIEEEYLNTILESVEEIMANE